MSDTAVADEKKEKEFLPGAKLPRTGKDKMPDFTEKVTVRIASGDNKPIASTREGISAYRCMSDKGKAFYLSTKDFGAGAIPKGSEIADEDGFVYVVQSNPNTARNRLVYVEKKKP